MTRVVDTSVAVKWFTIEEHHQLAKALIGQPLIAPELIVAEVANTVWRKVRIAEIGREQAELAQSLVTSFVELVKCAPLASRALDIAIELDHPAYDCFYLALAEEIQTTVITFDRRLLTACAGTRFESRVELLT